MTPSGRPQQYGTQSRRDADDPAEGHRRERLGRVRQVDDIWLEAEPARAGESREGRVRQLDDWSRERPAQAALAVLDRAFDEFEPDEAEVADHFDESLPASLDDAATTPDQPGVDATAAVGTEVIPAAVPGRRTVTITGRGAERSREAVAYSEQRAAARNHRRERPHRKPDRVAMWAVLLGLALAVGAATSSHAAVLTHVARAFGH